MPSRRSHTKTRLGCLTCKQRRVRCDLVRPVCASCARLEKRCAWPDNSFIQAGPTGLHGSKATAAAAQGSGDLRSLTSVEWIEDMQLLHHYAVQTSLTLAEEPHKQDLWQKRVPEHAFKHHYLLHSILAVAALHQSSDLPAPKRDRWIAVAGKHRALAVDQYTPLIQVIGKENCHALYASGVLLAVATYGLSQVHEVNSRPEEFIDIIIQACDFLKGSATVAEIAQDWLARGDISGLVSSPPATSDSVAAARQMSGTGSALGALLVHLQSVALVDDAEAGATATRRVPPANQAYNSSINSLFPVLAASPTRPSSVSTVISWPRTVDPAYFVLLKERDPTALVILSYYGTALHRLTDVWWLKGVGGKIHGATTAVVGAEWRPYLTMSSWQVSKTSMLNPKHMALNGAGNELGKT